MRHLVKGKKLGMNPAHRKATLQALCVALIKEHRIVTTLAKAKELRRVVEPIITRSKEDTTHNRRQAFSKLQDKFAVTELFEEVGPKVNGRPGGYTRVLKIGARAGDNTEMAVIELVDYNDVKPDVKRSDRKRTRRGGSGGGKSGDSQPSKSASEKAEPAVAETEDDPKVSDSKASVSESGVVDSKDHGAESVDAPEEVSTEEGPTDSDAAADSETAVADSETAVADSETAAADSETAAADSETAAADSETAAADSETAAADSSDFTVVEVKEQLEDMSPEEAKEFVGDDERVTVQKALDKKLEEASDSGTADPDESKADAADEEDEEEK